MKKIITSYYANYGDGCDWYKGQTYQNHQKYAESIEAEYRFLSGEELISEYVPKEVQEFLFRNLNFGENSYNFALFKPFVPTGCYIDPDIIIYNPTDIFKFYDPDKICFAGESDWQSKNEKRETRKKHLDALNILQPVEKRKLWNSGLFLYSEKVRNILTDPKTFIDYYENIIRILNDKKNINYNISSNEHYFSFMLNNKPELVSLIGYDFNYPGPGFNFDKDKSFSKIHQFAKRNKVNIHFVGNKDVFINYSNWLEKKNQNLILGYERGSNKWQGLSNALQIIGEESEVIVDNFDKIEGPYKRIWTMGESLLPLQAQLEQKWNINNVSVKAAEILSDKKKMDDFCIGEGLEALIPKSVIPISLKDFEMFEGGPFIIKPVIGSGTKQNRDHRIHYMTYHNVDSFIEDTYSELLFQINKTGFTDEEFGGRTNYYMAQEYLPHNKLYAPYIYVNEHGAINHIFWVEGNIETYKIDNNRFESRPIDFMSIDYTAAPKEVISACEFYFETIVGELDIKSMFFAGPDFYYEEGLPTKVIDCNPRIGQGLQLLNELNDNKIIPSLLQNSEYNIETHMLWKNVKLKPGKIKTIKDYSHLKKYITSTSLDGLHPGDIIEEFTNTPAIATPKVSLKIPGNTKTDMLETYRSISELIQSCIVYNN